MKEKQICREERLFLLQISDPTLPMKATKAADPLSQEAPRAPLPQSLSPANLPPRAPGITPPPPWEGAQGSCWSLWALCGPSPCCVPSGRSLRSTCSETPAFQGLLSSLYFHLYSWASLKFLLEVRRGRIHEDIKIM